MRQLKLNNKKKSETNQDEVNKRNRPPDSRIPTRDLRMSLYKKEKYMETRENRIGWIDAIKAICMFAVMINHQPLAHDGLCVDYFFLVGFFFCSGLTYRAGRSLKYRLVRVVDSLVIPYFLLSAVTFFLYLKNIRGLVGGDMSVVADRWHDVLMGHALWFIPCLISVEILYALAQKLKAENYIVWGGGTPIPLRSVGRDVMALAC